MMFWKKPNKIHLDCFTLFGVYAKDNPIQKASNFIPEWYRGLENYIVYKNNNGIKIKSPTMRGCLGFIDLYSRGVIIPLWSDLNFKVENNSFAYQFASQHGLVETHNKDQFKNRYDNFIHFKIVSPWLIREKTGVNFLFTNCAWTSLEKLPKLNMMNGIVSYNLNQSCNINGFASLENHPYQYDLEAGTPLAHIIPLSDREVVPHIHVVNDSEWKTLQNDSLPYKFKNFGLTRRKLHRNK